MTGRGPRAAVVTAALTATVLLTAGCGGSGTPPGSGPGSTGAATAATTGAPAAATSGSAASGTSGSAASGHVGHRSEPARIAPLAAGERWIDLGIPGGSYTPQAGTAGTDDYRCMLLDPHLASDTTLSGVVLLPGNPGLVHHAIVYRVDPAEVVAAQARDAADPRLGWSCFGGSGLPAGGGDPFGLNSVPWVAAFATSGGEQRFAAGSGQQLKAGSRLVLQVHYNLLNGGGVDSTRVRLRLAPSGAALQPLHTLLVPAPVELPCRRGDAGLLCTRDNSVLDVVHRFGDQAGRTVAGLQLLCGGSLTAPRAGPTQSCTRPVTRTMTIRAVGGHMHMLGRSIRVDLHRADGSAQRLLDIRTWNFDDQRSSLLSRPVRVGPGDSLSVSCTHDASLRRQLPTLAKLTPRYVVWGEGSSDEMCLGIVSYTTS
jgi:hypothetical protein